MGLYFNDENILAKEQTCSYPIFQSGIRHLELGNPKNTKRAPRQVLESVGLNVSRRDFPVAFFY